MRGREPRLAGHVAGNLAQFFDGTTPRMTMESHAAPAYRMVMTFGEDSTPAATLNFPRGNSGDPTSPDWSNAQADWSGGTYQPLAFEGDAVDAAMRERTTLTP
jgi:acyl-homoserine lactone acylase PvdQ